MCIDVVAADPGAIGGSTSHEYHIESAVGEDTLKLCDKCGDAVNIELYTDVHQPSKTEFFTIPMYLSISYSNDFNKYVILIFITENCQYGSCTEKRRTVKGIEVSLFTVCCMYIY